MPRIGLISDSHASAEITNRAAGLLSDHGAEMLLHLGDICSTEVLDALLVPSPKSRDPLPVHIVFGNMDHDPEGLGRYAESLGITVDHPVGWLNFGQVRLVFLHGHERDALHTALEEGVQYLCYGHTHAVADHRRARTRLINPGALFRTAAPTVALLDTDTDELRTINVPR